MCLPEVPQKYPELPQKYPEVPKGIYKYLEGPQSTSKYREGPQNTKKYLKSTQKYWLTDWLTDWHWPTAPKWKPHYFRNYSSGSLSLESKDPSPPGYPKHTSRMPQETKEIIFSWFRYTLHEDDFMRGKINFELIYLPSSCSRRGISWTWRVLLQTWY